MKYLKKITLFIALCIITHISSCQAQEQAHNYNNYLYKKNVDHAHPQAIQRLTQESYISPEMQWAILSFLGKQEATINTITGEMEGIQPVGVMMKSINDRLENNYIKPILYAEKESIKNALHAMLEATDIALFVTTVEAAYRDQVYTFHQNVDKQLTINLNNQKTAIQNLIKMINTLQPYDQPASTTSYFSWFSSSNTPAANYNSYVAPLQFNHNAHIVSIPAHLMQEIIKKNDYKQEPNAQEAANLLFKECFIAQQHHLKDPLWIHDIKINLQSPITPANYIYTNFPNVLQMCEIAQNLVSQNAMRTNLQASLSREQIAAHKLLLHIRQAIQTALYIANAKSSYNIGYALPSSVRSFLGGIVHELLEFDARLSTLCKDPMYGATPEDTYRDEQWATISKIAAGIVITAAVVGTAALVAPVATAAAAGKAVAAAGTVASYIPSAPDLFPKKPDGSSLSNWEKTKAVTDTIGTVGGMAAAYGGGAAFLAGGIKQADKAGYIQLDQITPGAREITDKIYNYGLTAATIGGTGMAIGGLGTAIDNTGKAASVVTDPNQGIIWGANKSKVVTTADGKLVHPEELTSGRLYNTGKILWNGTSSLVSGAAVGGAALGGAATIANQLRNNQNSQPTQQQPRQQNSQYNQPQQTAQQQVPTVQYQPETVAHAFIQSIQTSPENAVDNIRNASINLLQNNNIEPIVLLQVLQQVQQQTQDAAVSNGLHEFAQKLEQVIASQSVQN